MEDLGTLPRICNRPGGHLPPKAKGHAEILIKGGGNPLFQDPLPPSLRIDMGGPFEDF